MASILSAFSKPKLKKPKLPHFDTPEVLRDIGESVKKDVVKEGMHDFWKQVLDKYDDTEKKSHKLHGELKEGEELDLKAQSGDEKQKSRADITPGLEYGRDYTRGVLRSSEKAMHKENKELEQQVEQILVEIKQLMQESQELKNQFVQIAVSEKPVEIGKYHLGFFEMVLNLISDARRKIEGASSWMAASKGKQGKRDYWSMFQKHGTSFGMSNERNVSTQSG